MYSILFSNLCNWQDCYACATFLAAEGHKDFLWAEAKRDLALNLPAALPLKYKQYLPANPASYEGYLSSRTSSLIYLP